MTDIMENLGGGVIAFPGAINVPTVEIVGLIDELSDASLREQYQFVYDHEGNPLHAINNSGFIYELNDIYKNPIRIQNLNHPFFKECEDVIYQCLLRYIELFPALLQCLWWKSEGHVLKYPTGSSLGFHCDNDVNYKYEQLPTFEQATRNVVTALVYMNSNNDDGEFDEFCFAGGQMKIPYFDITVKPISGTVLLMPANYLGAHEIMEVTSGSRYSYLSWFAQGSPNEEKGIFPQVPDATSQRQVGGQWWMPELVADYENYLMKKYEDEGKIPIGAAQYKSRKDDHK